MFIALVISCYLFSLSNKIQVLTSNYSIIQQYGNPKNYELRMYINMNRGINHHLDSIPKSYYTLHSANVSKHITPINISDSIMRDFEGISSEYNDIVGVFNFKFRHNRLYPFWYIDKTKNNFFNEDGLCIRYYPSKKIKKNGITYTEVSHKIAHRKLSTLNFAKFGFSIEDTNGFPSFFAPYDVSQNTFDISFDTDTLNELSVNLMGATEFSRMIPEPDIVSMNSITFTDSDKLRMIRNNGLKFHVKYPTLQNIQSMRTYLITTFISLFFTLFTTLLYKLIKDRVIRKK